MTEKTATLRHINTGCRYNKHGQRITIQFCTDGARFYDHARSVHGTVISDFAKTPMAVVVAYVKNEYVDYIEDDDGFISMGAQDLAHFGNEVDEWEDISKAYANWVRTSFYQ